MVSNFFFRFSASHKLAVGFKGKRLLQDTYANNNGCFDSAVG